jgi:hypothetical protein
VKPSAILTLALLVSSPFGIALQKANLTKKPPKGAIILFDGKDSSHWLQRGTQNACPWLVEEGCLVNKPGHGDIVTQQNFGSYQLHVEFRLPLLANEHDQERANSGCYQQGRYEIQILDSYNNPTYKAGGCGSIYSFKNPDKNAILPPEEWNSYDITFHSARYDDAGKRIADARITVVHNGVLIHNDVDLTIPATAGGIDNLPNGEGPIILQDHGAAVRFRNIWIQPLAR